MCLAIGRRDQLAVAIDRDQRVERALGVIGDLEHPRDDRDAGVGGELGDRVDERTVHPLGDRPERQIGRAEVVHAPLGQHDQVGTSAARPARPARSIRARLVVDVRGRRELDCRYSHGPSLPRDSSTMDEDRAGSPDSSLDEIEGGRISWWSSTRSCWPVGCPHGSTVPTRAPSSSADVRCCVGPLDGSWLLADRPSWSARPRTPRLMREPAAIAFVTENPPRGGPAAAVAAGLAVTDARPRRRPRLRHAVRRRERPCDGSSRQLRRSSIDGALLIDETGRRQYLAAAYRAARLRAALDRLDTITERARSTRLIAALTLSRDPGRS